MLQRLVAVAIFATCLTQALPTVGAILYSIDSSTDQLVRIDSVDGTITAVGPIGHDMNRVAMTSLNGLLYATTSNQPDVFANAGFTLVTINPASGAKLTVVPVTSGGSAVSILESMTSFQGGLVVGFDQGALTSRRTGDLNPLTGEVTGPSARGPDWDAMATDSSGQIYGIDTINFSGDNRQIAFYTIERNPSSSAFIGDYVAADSVLDLAFAGDTLFALDVFSHSLLQLSVTSRAKLSELSLGAPGTNLSGLAFLGSESEFLVPEPPSCLLVIGICGTFCGFLLLRRRANCLHATPVDGN